MPMRVRGWPAFEMAVSPCTWRTKNTTHLADAFEWLAWTARLYSSFQRICSNIYKLSALLILRVRDHVSLQMEKCQGHTHDVADEKGLRSVPVEFPKVDSNVDVHNVTVLERPAIRNAVRDNIIHARAA